MTTEFSRLKQVIAALRTPETGCPWDLQQTHQSLIPYLIEETYEVVDAIENGADDDLAEELGDVLMQVVLHARIAQEAARFDLDDIAARLTDKIIRRHPHVFDNQTYADQTELDQAWERQKEAEQSEKSSQNAFFNNIPRSFTALMRAQKIQKKVAKKGFDWEQASDVIPKIHEELKEVETLMNHGGSQERLEEEIGDLLFAVVNLARHLKVNSEEALRLGNQKFERRFTQLQQYLQTKNKPLELITLAEMEAAWQIIKTNEKR